MPAIELGGMTLGMREGVIVLITLVAIYMVFVLLRMRRLRSQPTPVASRSSPGLPVEEIPVLDDVEPLSASTAESVPDVEMPWEQPSNGLAEGVLRQGLEQELAQLRDEVDAIRGELAALREDMRQEVAHMHSAQAISPVYGDAMQMAAAGYDPVMIADRCGIARAEAELVVALAKSQVQ